jgi:5-methylcytosine-specific restriction endonuclease McrA
VQHVFVLGPDRTPLSPVHPGEARTLLSAGKAAVLRRFPFTVILKEATPEVTNTPVTLKIDPGSKVTGIALVGPTGKVLFAAELTHRGQRIKARLAARQACRQFRRSRKTRYRKPRFLNRTRSAGWLPPSLQHRVLTIMTWVKRFRKFCNVTGISVERVKFDMQVMQNPEISGIEYQHGTLQGYTVKEYLLEKWNRACAYCGGKDVPFEVEHIVPKSAGGSNRVSNLALACHDCNEYKGKVPVETYLKNKPEVLKRILSQAKLPLRDAAAVNATRNALFTILAETGLPVETGTGAQTKYNRKQQHYPKAHWIDAACTGVSGESVFLDPKIKFLSIVATGHGNRQICGTDRFGFPNRHRTRNKDYFGFHTGAVVKAVVLRGKKVGVYYGRVICRASGRFDLQTSVKRITGISHQCCAELYKLDSYHYL